jgi:hypothetical protein
MNLWINRLVVNELWVTRCMPQEKPYIVQQQYILSPVFIGFGRILLVLLLVSLSLLLYCESTVNHQTMTCYEGCCI